MKSLMENALKTGSIENKNEHESLAPRIMVIGTGGAGCNTVNRISSMGVNGAQLVAVNTDKQHLSIINDELTKILIGKSVTRGLGAGGYPDVGAKAAEVSRQALEEVLSNTDMLFISAGMGGGTGTGSAPIIAEIAKEQGAIVIAIVTYPFALEKARLVKAEEGIENLRANTDTVVVIDNNRLVGLVPNLPIQDAFKVADEVTARTVRGITETITQPSLINLDFADVKSIMKNQKLSVIAVGENSGNNKEEEVVRETLKNSLLDVDVSGATGALIHITGGPEMTLGEANKVGELLTESIDPKASVIWGARIDPAFTNKIEVISIFTGLNSKEVKRLSTMQEQKRDKTRLGLGSI